MHPPGTRGDAIGTGEAALPTAQAAAFRHGVTYGRMQSHKPEAAEVADIVLPRLMREVYETCPAPLWADLLDSFDNGLCRAWGLPSAYPKGYCEAAPMSESQSQGAPIDAKSLPWAALDSLPEIPPDAIDGLIPGHELTILGARGGEGKSMLALNWLLAVATGQGLANGINPHWSEGAPALFLSLEESRARILYRIMAAANINPQLRSGPLSHLHIAGKGTRVPSGGPAAFGAWVRSEIERTAARLIVIDPYSRLGMAEDNEVMGAVSNELAIVAEETRSSIVLAHHLRKPPPGLNHVEPSMNDLRGGSALANNARAVILLWWDGTAIKQIAAKGNHAARGAATEICWRTIGVDVLSAQGQPHNTGALIPWQETSPIEQDEAEQVAMIRKALALPDWERILRTGLPGWFGFAIAKAAGLDIGAGYTKAELSGKVDSAPQLEAREGIRLQLRSWMRKGWLSKGKGRNQSRNEINAYFEGPKLPVN